MFAKCSYADFYADFKPPYKIGTSSLHRGLLFIAENDGRVSEALFKCIVFGVNTAHLPLIHIPEEC